VIIIYDSKIMWMKMEKNLYKIAIFKNY